MEKYILTNILISENKEKKTGCHHDYASTQEQKEASTCQCRPWPHRQASQASWRSGKGWRSASSSDTDGQVPSRVFRESRHAVLPQDSEQVPLPSHQLGRPVVASQRANAQELR